MKKQEIKEKIIKISKWLFKTAYKIGVITAGATAFTNPVSGAIAGTSVVASVISSVFKDKNLKPAMKIINALAINFDNAENDKVTNEVIPVKKNARVQSKK